MEIRKNEEQGVKLKNSPYKLPSVFVYSLNHSSDAMRKFLQVKNNRVFYAKQEKLRYLGDAFGAPWDICLTMRPFKPINQLLLRFLTFGDI